MNYSVADAARTVALSDLDFLVLPDNALLYKRSAFERLKSVIGRVAEAV
jgi:hypothetical protein